SGAAQPVEPGLGAVARAVLLDQVQPLERDVKLRVLLISQEHKIALPALGLDLPQTSVEADAVVHVNNVVAYLEVVEIGEETRGKRPLAAGGTGRGPEQIRVREDRKGELGENHAVVNLPADECHRPPWRHNGRAGRFGRLRPPRHLEGKLVVRQNLRHTAELSGAG